MNPTTFDSVNWEDLQDTLALKPKKYQLWIGKQCPGYCGTGEMLKRWDKTVNSSCPTSGVRKETADHLNRCSNKEQRLMLIKCMNDIKEWMADNQTYPELIEWVPKYLLRKRRATSWIWVKCCKWRERWVGSGQDRLETLHGGEDITTDQESTRVLPTFLPNPLDHWRLDARPHWKATWLNSLPMNPWQHH